MSSKKILIVEDELSLVHALELHLDSIGYKIISANNGEEGLKMVKEEKPDLILLDILMPKMDGEEMFDKLKQDKDLKDTKILVITNYTNDPLAKKFEEAGVEYLVKADYSILQIAQKCEELLS